MDSSDDSGSGTESDSDLLIQETDIDTDDSTDDPQHQPQPPPNFLSFLRETLHLMALNLLHQFDDEIEADAELPAPDNATQSTSLIINLAMELFFLNHPITILRALIDQETGDLDWIEGVLVAFNVASVHILLGNLGLVIFASLHYLVVRVMLANDQPITGPLSIGLTACIVGSIGFIFRAFFDSVLFELGVLPIENSEF